MCIGYVEMVYVKKGSFITNDHNLLCVRLSTFPYLESVKFV